MLYKWYHYQNLYSAEECKRLLELSQQLNSNQHKDIPGSGKNVDVSVVPLEPLRVDLSKMLNFVTQVNEEFFGFDLFPSPKSVNINRYNEAYKEYPWHADNSVLGSTADTKLTAVLNISNQEYVGGAFEMFVGETVEMKELSTVGSLLIFPSYMYHRVTPVTSGERLTLSCWFKGPNWK
jgi:PKHD-type hydroxylase